MTNDWILDVLADLRAFADANGLSATGEHLDDAVIAAAAEIAALEEGRTRSLRVPPLDDGDAGHDTPADRIRQNA